MQILNGVPTELIEKWGQIEPAKFNQERAVMCFHLAGGAWRDVNPQTIQDCFTAKTPSFGAVGHYVGQEPLRQMVREMLALATALLNVGKNLRQEQILPTVDFLLRQPGYKLFTVADFQLAIDRGIGGKYGSTYDRLDVTVICTWLDQYWEERMEAAETMAESQHHSQALLSEAGKDAQYMPEWFKKATEAFQAKYNPEPKEIEPDQPMITQWRKDWEEIEGQRPSFEGYVKLQILKLQKTK